MNRIKEVAELAIAVVIAVAAVTIIAVLVGSLSDLGMNRARLAEAEANLAQAQAQIETARGERAVLEAAARTVDMNRKLVGYYSVRGDLFTALWVVVALVIAVVVIHARYNIITG